MKSYPTTRTGKIHIRVTGTLVSGTVACGRTGGSSNSVSTSNWQVATCKACKKAFEDQVAISNEIVNEIIAEEKK